MAIGDGVVDTNPVRAIKLFGENNQRVRFLADEEETALREKIGDENWPVVAVAVHTGLRQTEEFGLRWENVDFQTGIITVPRSKHGEKRHVPMNDTAREILCLLPSWMKGDYVFPSATGETPIDPCNFIARVFRKALNKASVEDFRWHDLRHAFASRLVLAGVDLRTVQEPQGTRPS